MSAFLDPYHQQQYNSQRQSSSPTNVQPYRSNQNILTNVDLEDSSSIHNLGSSDIPVSAQPVPHSMSNDATTPTPTQSHSISSSSKAFFVLMGVLFVCWGLFISWPSAFVLPFLLLPSIALYAWWRRNRATCDLDTVIIAFAKGFSPAAALTFSLEIIVVLITTLLVSRDLFVIPDDGLAIVIFAVWSCMVIVEELVKYKLASTIITDPEYQTRTPPGRERLVYLASTIWGFATGMAVFTCFFYGVLRTQARKTNVTEDVFVLALVQSVIGSSFHWITGYLTGIKITLRDTFNNEQYRSKFSILWVPIIVRVFLVFHILACLNGIFTNYNWAEFWLVFFIPPIVLFIVLCYHTRVTEKKLPLEYLQRVGGLVSGYGLVPDSEPLSSRVVPTHQHTLPQTQQRQQGRARTPPSGNNNTGGRANASGYQPSEPSLFLSNAPQSYDVNNVNYSQYNPDGSVNTSHGLSNTVINSGVPIGVVGAGIASPTNITSPHGHKTDKTSPQRPSSSRSERGRAQVDEKRDDPEAKVRNFLDI